MLELVHRGRSVRDFGLAALSVLACVLAACGDETADGDGVPASAPERLSIGVLLVSSGTYDAAVREGVDEAVAADDVDATFFDAQLDPQRQLGQCQDAIATGKHDGLLVEAVDGTVIEGCVREAISAGIEVVGVEVPLGPKSMLPLQIEGVSGQVVMVPSSQGKANGELVERACEGLEACKVGYFQISPSFTVSTEQKRGTLEQLADDPHIEVVVTATTGFNDPDAARAAAQNLYAKDRELDVIVGDDDSSMQGAVRWLQQSDLVGKVKLIGTGANAESVKAIADGLQYGTTINTPRSDAVAATEMLIRAVRGEPIEQRAVDYAALSPLGPGVLALTRENLEAFEAEW